jgi:hypothetical protein
MFLHPSIHPFWESYFFQSSSSSFDFSSRRHFGIKQMRFSLQRIFPIVSYSSGANILFSSFKREGGIEKDIHNNKNIKRDLGNVPVWHGKGLGVCIYIYIFFSLRERKKMRVRKV